ncbi:MAG: translation initiation factor IF-6 [Candidatus Micrarchaeota archaeon]|nr:translation initiation factor IF-6 [Candidatus Micrarchaeota archaeon]
MRVAKLSIEGNSFIGAFGLATDKFALICSNVNATKTGLIEDTLQVKVAHALIDNSKLIGIYAIANSNGMLLPFTSYHTEVEHIKKALKEFNIDIFKSDMNALRNNILANDKVAIINPYYSHREEEEIRDILGVETIKREIAGFSTVGANNIVTNRGLVLNNRVTDDEKKEIEDIFGLKGEQSTANLGSLTLGLSVIANSNGAVVGEATTGFELARITNGLNLPEE